MNPEFEVFEVVRLAPNAPLPSRLRLSEGVILGRSQNEDGCWGYSVQLKADDDKCWSVDEQFLVKTGRKVCRSEIYDGTSIRVNVDPQTGCGSVRSDG